MQVNQPQGGSAEASTPDAELRLVSIAQLKKIHRDLDACQKVIWLSGCRPHVPNGFDPSYVTDAQERLKEIEVLLVSDQVKPLARWVPVTDALPECSHECTTDHLMVSDTVLVTDASAAMNMGMAHLKDDGAWVVYQGEHDFMNPESITHWMPMPMSPAMQVQGGNQ
jgi:hypothetical protein